VTNPTIGSDFIARSPGPAYRRLRSFTATLTTSATAANRNVTFAMVDAENVQIGALASVPASSTVIFTAAIGYHPYTDAGGNQYLPLPDLGLSLVANTLTMLNSATANLQAGDQWSGIRMNWEEWVYFF
jgi:hypothetical protein